MIKDNGMTMGGYYDENGTWVQTKHCFVHCGDRCNCQPPGGIYQLPTEELKDEDDK